MTHNRTPADQRHERPPGWADDRIPPGFVSKREAAARLRVATVTIDRWSREQSADWPHPQLLTRYYHPGYPYTLFDIDEITKIQEGT